MLKTIFSLLSVFHNGNIYICFSTYKKKIKMVLLYSMGNKQAGILSCSKHGISETGSSKVNSYISEYLNNGDLLVSHQVF